MRKHFVIALSLLLLIPLSLKAQDVILKTDGSTVLAKVVSITANEVEYYLWTAQSGPLYVIKQADIRQINYQNGQKDVFPASAPQVTTAEIKRLEGRPLLNAAYGRVFLLGESAQHDQLVALMGSKRADELSHLQFVAGFSGFMTYGMGCVFVGGGLLLTGLSFNKYYVDQKGTFLTLGLISLALGAIDIPLSIKAYERAEDKMYNIVSEYNKEVRKEQKKTPPPTLSFSGTRNGLGLVYRF